MSTCRCGHSDDDHDNDCEWAMPSGPCHLCDCEAYNNTPWSRKSCPNDHAEKCYEQSVLTGRPYTYWMIPDEEQASLGVRIQRNGIRAYIIKCRKCKCRIVVTHKKADELMRGGWQVEWQQNQLDNVETWYQHNIVFDGARCCVKGCENEGFEYHHFAPRNVFGFAEADKWPCLPLCMECHKDWHRKMSDYTANQRAVDWADYDEDVIATELRERFG